MPRNVKEHVSVSFHFLARRHPSDFDKLVPITQAEFDEILDRVASEPDWDVDDPKHFDRLKWGSLIPLRNFTRISDSLAFGTFKAPYTGHSFDNSEKGKISAASLNQREFHYVIYRSKSGRIYVGAQYLGNYGGFGYLCDALKRKFTNSDRLETHSFRTDGVDLRNAIIKEVRVTISQNSSDITQSNIFDRSNVIVVKRKRGDLDFDAEASKSIVPIFSGAAAGKRAQLARVLNAAKLYSVSEDEIEDCSIVVQIGGSTRTIYLFEQGGFASKFPIEVPLNEDGHPLMKETRDEMRRILRDHIISKSEDI
ncbi:MAG: hypothetical protein SFV20_04685 [Sphingopyxis sp.]|nr:hypothetical protein [Sphingopyxis sp.]